MRTLNSTDMMNSVQPTMMTSLPKKAHPMLSGSPEVEVCDGGSLSGFTSGRLAIPDILLASH